MVYLSMRDKRAPLRAAASSPTTCMQVVKFGIFTVLLTSLFFFILITNESFNPHLSAPEGLSSALGHPKDFLEVRQGAAGLLRDPSRIDQVASVRTDPLASIGTSTATNTNTNYIPNSINSNSQTITNENSRSTISGTPSDITIANTQPPTNDVQSRIAQMCPNIKKPSSKFFNVPPFHKNNGSTDFHFIHIPKCGGTSMTAILREVSCYMDKPRNVDCCTNPGFCDWHAFRRCNAIKGCINHFPQRPFIFKPYPSITIMREPVSRLLSAWFYRGHSPNLDFFQVRPYFKDINLGKLPKVVFEEYIEMPEYQNIQTRMLGADSFPYRNITVTDDVWCSAVEAVNHIFFVGIQEAYELSIEVLLRELNTPLKIPILKERDMSNAGITKAKALLKNNKKLMDQVREINHYDAKLYELGVARFCSSIRKYPDLWKKLTENHPTVKCPSIN